MKAVLILLALVACKDDPPKVWNGIPSPRTCTWPNAGRVGVCVAKRKVYTCVDDDGSIECAPSGPQVPMEEPHKDPDPPPSMPPATED